MKLYDFAFHPTVARSGPCQAVALSHRDQPLPRRAQTPPTAAFADLVPGQFRHGYIGANGQTALAFYRPPSPGAPHLLHAIQLVTTREGAIATVDHFMQPEFLASFGAPAQFRESAHAAR